MGKVFLTVGLLGLCHAAYSATQHRNYLRLTENEFSVLPLDIILQTLVSLLVSCWGIVTIASGFRPIKITSEWENKVWDNIANRTSFYSFNHRGKHLFSQVSGYSDISGSISNFDNFPLLEDSLRRQEQLEEQQLRVKLAQIREKKEQEKKKLLLLQQQQHELLQQQQARLNREQEGSASDEEDSEGSYDSEN